MADKHTKQTVTIVASICAGMIWAVPLWVGSTQTAAQYRNGNGSLFLIGIGIAPYLSGLLIAILGPAWLRRTAHNSAALGLAIVMLVMGVGAALLLAVGLGST